MLARETTVKIGEVAGDGFVCEIFEDADGRIHFVADADIDADGANGQHGAPAAYLADDSGTEALANGGMKIVGGRVVCAQPWARDVVIVGDDGQPRTFPGDDPARAIIASKTWYQYPGADPASPDAYVDAQTVPYIVVPPVIMRRARGVVRGCRAMVTWQGQQVACVVADRGPSDKIGELSIAAAAALGIPSSPRSGGVSGQSVRYELWPGVPASQLRTTDGRTEEFVLQPA